MNLIIDIGNTKTKVAVFKDNEMICTKTCDFPSNSFIDNLLLEFPSIENSIISSVRQNSEEMVFLLESRCRKVIFFNSEVPVPLENLYESKNTLGPDRLAACVGASVLYPNQNLLVIDAGTAITFDFVNAQSQYLGGTISLGLTMRFKALHEFTQKLPLLSFNEAYHLIGKNTTDAIVSGVQNGLLFEVESYIQKTNEIYPELEVILTGGDSAFIKSSICKKSNLHPEILLKGLNAILQYNLLIIS